jgi:transposase InsO family protein
MVGPAAKREAVTHLKAVMGLSERRACQIISADRKTIRYRPSRPPEVELRAKLRDLANERRRFGYRRLFILLRRDGEPSGVNRIYRLGTKCPHSNGLSNIGSSMMFATSGVCRHLQCNTVVSDVGDKLAALSLFQLNQTISLHRS